MEDVVAYFTIIVAFFATLVFTKYWIRVARKAGLLGKDMNKRDKPEIPEAGGVAVILGFSFAVLVYVFFKTFYLGSTSAVVFIFALLSSVLLAGFLGFIDDMLGWKIGLRQWHKPLLTLPAVIPLVVINAGVSTMNVPFLGVVNFGILYPLCIIPLGIIGAANGFNFIAGHNSLEAGMGAIILGTLGIVITSQGAIWLSIVCFSAVAALLGFMAFNRYPAKVFPGDSLTYSMGTLIAIVAILGNVEKLALIMFIPYFLEFILKSRSRFGAESFGIPDRENRLMPPSYKGRMGTYSLTHAAMVLWKRAFNKKPKEYDVVLSLFILELLVASVVVFVV